MTQAKITVNAVVGSNTDFAINTLVSLDNQGSGGELTFAWSITDQPAGAADVLSSTIIHNPTFTPKKEGTYRIQLIVNLGLADQKIDAVVVGVRQLKTRQRIPAAGETTEADASEGWHTPVGTGWLQLVDRMRGDPGLMIGVIAGGGSSRGDTLTSFSVTTIKAGLPGAEVVLALKATNATVPSDMRLPLYILEGGVDGSLSPGAGALVFVRIFGRCAGISRNPPPAVNSMLFVTDAGILDLTPGTTPKLAGRVVASDGVAKTFDADVFAFPGGAHMAPAIVIFGNTTTPAAAGTTFLDPYNCDRVAPATEAFFDAPFPGAIKAMRVRSRVADAGGQIVYTLRIGGVDTTITATLPAGVATGSDLAHSSLVNAGDKLSLKAVSDVGASGAADVLVSLEFEGA